MRRWRDRGQVPPGTKADPNIAVSEQSARHVHPGATSERNQRATPAVPAVAGTMKLIRRLGLTYISTDKLTLHRAAPRPRLRYLSGDDTRSASEAQRLTSLAVPPAQRTCSMPPIRSPYPGDRRDAAGRLQYRYHADRQRVRETRKARRLARLAEALPRIRRSIGQHLARRRRPAPTLAAIIELVACTAIRPGTEQYAVARHPRRGDTT